jgi:hypothetical protein
MTTRHFSWEKEVDLSEPTMINLQRFPSGTEYINIPLVICDKAREFCNHLLVDKDGSKFREIETKHKNSYQEINVETLECWVRGGGKQPVTWDMLIATLQEVEMPVLAKQIQVGVVKWKKEKNQFFSKSLPTTAEHAV